MAIVLLGISCKKEQSFPEVPAITYKNYSKFTNTLGKDSILLLRFDYTDGDGDIGFGEADTFYPNRFFDPYYFNLFCDFIVIDSGKQGYCLFPGGDTVNFNQRINSITPSGRNKSISGEIELRIDFTALLVNAINPDSAFFRVKLMDRKYNSSNTFETEIIRLTL